MSRFAAPWPVLVVAASIAFAPVARADEMDVALSHLRVPGGDPRCPLPEGSWCVDAELFERLLSEVAMAVAPGVVEPAATLGASGFYLGVSSSVTTIAADGTHWIRGSEGDAANADELTNTSPSSALVWNRIHARKGLPFGLELGASAGHALATSTWAAGANLKLAIIEGLRSRPRYMPDVAVRLSYERMFGSHQFDLDVVGLDLLVSRPFLVSDEWLLAPLGAVQMLWVDVDGGLVDLTPEGPLGCQNDCSLGGADPQNTVRLPRMSQRRYRLVVGAEARRDWLLITGSVAYDPAPPDVDTAMPAFGGRSVEAQLSVQLATGVRF